MKSRKVIISLFCVIFLFLLFIFKDNFTPFSFQRKWNNLSFLEYDFLKFNKKVPILIYHHIQENVPNDRDIKVIVSKKQFREQMKYLFDNGYTTITFEDMVSYVEEGKKLPKKPVCITFDDGYLSNYTLAYPILKSYGMKATVFVTGTAVGLNHDNKDKKSQVKPHFNYEEAKIMSDSGVFSIQSHTYNLHQTDEYDKNAKVHKNILKLSNETEEEYEDFLMQDLEKSRSKIEAVTGKPVFVLAYPYGIYNEKTEEVYALNGVKSTLTINSGKAKLIVGRPCSLFALPRIFVTSSMRINDFRKVL